MNKSWNELLKERGFDKKPQQYSYEQEQEEIRNRAPEPYQIPGRRPDEVMEENQRNIATPPSSTGGFKITPTREMFDNLQKPTFVAPKKNTPAQDTMKQLGIKIINGQYKDIPNYTELPEYRSKVDELAKLFPEVKSPAFNKVAPLLNSEATKSALPYLGEKAKSGLSSAAEGMQSVYNIGDNPVVPKGRDLFQKEITKDRKAFAQAENENVNGILRIAGDATEAVTRMLPNIMLGAAGGPSVIPLTLMGASAAGSARQEALTAGATEQQATTYGLLIGGIEGATESIIGGIPFMKGIADKGVSKLTSPIKNKFAKILATKAIDALGEGGEEIIAGFLEPYAKRTTFDKTAANKSVSELAKDFGMGVLVSGVLQLPQTSVDLYRTARTSSDINNQAVIAADTAVAMGNKYKSAKMLDKTSLADMDFDQKINLINQTKEDLQKYVSDRFNQLETEEYFAQNKGTAEPVESKPNEVASSEMQQEPVATKPIPTQAKSQIEIFNDQIRQQQNIVDDLEYQKNYNGADVTEMIKSETDKLNQLIADKQSFILGKEQLKNQTEQAYDYAQGNIDVNSLLNQVSKDNPTRVTEQSAIVKPAEETNGVQGAQTVEEAKPIEQSKAMAETPEIKQENVPTTQEQAESSPVVKNKNDNPELEALKNELTGIEQQLDKINQKTSSESELDRTYDTFIGGVGGNAETPRLKKIRENAMNASIERSKKATPLYEKRRQLMSKISDIESGKAEQRKTAREKAELDSVKKFINIKSGDMVDIGGNSPVKVAKKNAKSIVTTSGTKYTMYEVTGIFDDAKLNSLISQANDNTAAEEKVLEQNNKNAVEPKSRSKSTNDGAMSDEEFDKYQKELKENSIGRTIVYDNKQGQKFIGVLHRTFHNGLADMATIEYDREIMPDGTIKPVETATVSIMAKNIEDYQEQETEKDESQQDRKETQIEQKQEEPVNKESIKDYDIESDPFKRATKITSVINRGEPVTVETVKQEVDYIFNNETAIKESLSKMKKDDIIKYARSAYARDYNKDELIKHTYETILTNLYYAVTGKNSYSYTFGESYVNKLKSEIDTALEGMTRDKLDKMLSDNKTEYEESIAKRKARIEGLKNPKTIDDFEAKKRVSGLTPEEQETYEDMLAEKKKEDRTKAKEIEVQSKANTAIRSIGDVQYSILEEKHTKTGEPVWVVRLPEKVERETWEKINVSMRALGGNYWSGNKGWNFKFNPTDKLQGNVSTSIEETENQKEENRVSKLREVADNMQETIDEKFADRLANTARRANMAASAEADGRRLQRIQTTLRNIADAIESGKTKLIDKIDSRAQIETLEGILNRAKYLRVQEEFKNASYPDREAERYKPFEAKDIRYAEMPLTEIYNDTLQSFIKAVQGKKGFTLIANRLSKLKPNAENKVNVSKFIDEVAKIVKNEPSISNYWEDALAERKRLERMGIESVGELRAYLREYIQFREGAKEKTKADRIKDRQLEMIGMKIEGYFPTPKTIVDKMLDYADIQTDDKVLEPSAGQGHIADEIRNITSNIDVAEWSGANKEILELKEYNIVGNDALQIEGQYDKIVMNPPFEKNQDIKHVRYAYDNNLKPGGKLVSIMSEHAFFANDKESVEFRDWLDSIDGASEKLPEGSFKESDRSTGVNTRIVVVDKPIERPQSAHDRQAAETKRLQDLGIQATGVRLADAEQTGKMYELYQSGEIKQNEWEDHIDNLIKENRISDKSVLGEDRINKVLQIEPKAESKPVEQKEEAKAETKTEETKSLVKGVPNYYLSKEQSDEINMLQTEINNASSKIEERQKEGSYTDRYDAIKKNAEEKLKALTDVIRKNYQSENNNWAVDKKVAESISGVKSEADIKYIRENPPEKPLHPKTYFVIKAGTSKKFTETNGSPVDFNGMDLFTHKIGGAWAVSEGKTGVRIEFGSEKETKKSVVDKAIETINKFGVEGINKRIADLLKTEGASPRYIGVKNAKHQTETLAENSEYSSLKSELDSLIASKATATEEEIKAIEKKISGVRVKLQQFASSETVAEDVEEAEEVSKFYTNSVLNSLFIEQNVKDMLDEADFTYGKQTNEGQLKEAAENIKRDMQGVIDEIRSSDALQSGTMTAEALLIGKIYYERGKQTGNTDQFREWLEIIQPKITSTAQSLQAVSMWKRFSPENVLIKAAKIVKEQRNQKQENEIDDKGKDIKKKFDESEKEASEDIVKDVQDKAEDIVKKKRAKNEADKVTDKQTNDVKQKDIDEVDPVELLMVKIESTLNEPKAPEHDYVTDMVNELFNVAKESPLPFRESIKEDPVQILAQAIQNRQQYKEVFLEAQEKLKEKYKDDTETMQMLNDYFSKGIKPVFSAKSLDKVIGKYIIGLKTAQGLSRPSITSLGEVVRDFYTSGNNKVKSMVDSIVKKSGLTNDEARELEKYVKNRMHELTKKKKEQILASTFNESVKGNYNPNKTIEELANLGAFQNSKYYAKAMTKLDTKLKNIIRESGIKLGELARSSIEEGELNKIKLMKSLSEQLKINDNELRIVTNLISQTFDNILGSRKKSILQNMFAQKKERAKKLFYQRIIELYNLGGFSDTRYRNLIAEKLGIPALSDSVVQEIMNLSEKIQNTPNRGVDNLMVREALKARITSTLDELQDTGTLKKISGFQAVQQLFGVKGPIRNIGGNELSYNGEKYSKYISSLIDFAVSKITGTDRQITYKTGNDFINMVINMGKDYAKSSVAAWNNYELFGTNKSQEEKYVNSSVRNFKGKYNPLSYMEKGTKVLMSDYAAYMRGMRDSLGEMSYLDGINKGLTGKKLKENAEAYMNNMSEEQFNKAKEFAERVTFRGKNILGEGLLTIKRGMNFKQEFGLGDIFLKYARTQGTLFSRSLEFSPAGFLKSMFHTVQAIRQAQGLINENEVKVEHRKEAIESFSRALYGTVLYSGLGFLLAMNGIISGSDSGDDDKDIRAAKEATGRGKYKLNVSALMRWLASGFDKESAKHKDGDKLFTYSWMQPVATSIGLGANIAENRKITASGVADAVVSSIEGILNTMEENPLSSGIKRLFQGYGKMDTAKTIIQTSVTGFTGTLPNQIRQLKDNYQRNTDDENFLKELVNVIKNKLPVLSETLPKRVSTTGQEKEVYQDGSNSIFNVFLNPAFVSSYEASPGLQLVLDLYEKTSETKQAPRSVATTITINKIPVKLTKEEINEFQKLTGQAVMKKLDEYSKNLSFRKLSEEKQIEAIVKVLDNASDMARKKMIAKLVKDTRYTSQVKTK